MHKRSSRVRTCFAVAVLGLTGVAAGCGESANLVSPSSTPTTSLSSELVNANALASAAHLSPTELVTRGWDCFQPPIPNRIVCGRPNQGRPTVGNPPPDDRPETFTFLVFEGSGLFVGTELLIRTDLYNGQLCESTGQPYIFRALIGYYECVHTVGS